MSTSWEAMPETRGESARGTPAGSSPPPANRPAGGIHDQGPPREGGRSGPWSVAMPAGIPLLSANGRYHHMQRHRLSRVLRAAAQHKTRAARVPRLLRARIVALYHPPDRRRRDVHNLLPAAKCCVDGLVDAGVLPDDNDDHLIGPDMRRGEVVARGQLVLHVYALDEIGD